MEFTSGKIKAKRRTVKAEMVESEERILAAQIAALEMFSQRADAEERIEAKSANCKEKSKHKRNFDTH